MRMAIRIERGIPAPNGINRNNEKYPFSELEPGDSFFAPHRDYNSKRVQQAAYAAASRLGIKVATRTMEDGVRVWRLE